MIALSARTRADNASNIPPVLRFPPRIRLDSETPHLSLNLCGMMLALSALPTNNFDVVCRVLVNRPLQRS